MTNFYVSKRADNGLPVGNDSTGTGSLAAPWLTIGKALASGSVVAGDTIFTNGDFTASSSDPGGLDYFNVAKAITLRPMVFGDILKATGAQAAVVRVLCAAGTAVAVKGYYIDAQVTAQSPFLHHSSNTVPLTVTDCTLANPALTAHLLDQNTSVKLTADNITLVGAATSGGIYASAMGATKRVELTRIKGSVTGITSSNGGAIYLNATAAGAKARIAQCDGLQATTSSLSSRAAVISTNGVVALIENNKGMMVNEGISGCVTAIIAVRPGSSAFLCENSVVRNNTGRNTCTGGYLLLAGSDGSQGATDNQCNYVNSSDNDFMGNPASTTMHGFIFGACKGGISSHDIARNVSISFLTKLQSESARFLNYKAIDPTTGNSISYSKGSVNARFIGGKAYLKNGYAGHMYRIESDPTIPTLSTGAVCSGGTVFCADPSGITLAVTVAASNDSTFDNNNYNFIVAAAATPWTYQGTTYATLALWAAAREDTARNVDPSVIDAAFWKHAYVAAAPGLSNKDLRNLLPLIAA